MLVKLDGITLNLDDSGTGPPLGPALAPLSAVWGAWPVMRILVTGGTGYVGSHTVAALLAAGHDVRLLVRSPDRIAPALTPLGVIEPVDHTIGEVTDPDSVDRALRGCDAVVHAAAVYDLVRPRPTGDHTDQCDRCGNRAPGGGTARL